MSCSTPQQFLPAAEVCSGGGDELLSPTMKSVPAAVRGATAPALERLLLAGVSRLHPSLLKECKASGLLCAPGSI